MRKNAKRISLYFMLAVLLLFIVVWVCSLIRIEILTNTYYDDFKYAHQSNTMLGQIEYFKVISCNDSTAQIYYVSKYMSDANIICFEKVDGNWVETSWRTIWSSTGSASDVIWPYWWHFIYGGL